MSVDNELLNKSNRDSSAAQAGDLREAQRGGNSSGTESAADGSSAPQSLREAVLSKKREDAIKSKNQIVAAASQPISRGTSKLLQQAWLHLVDSWGLTLLWIDIHVWLNSIFGDKFFCKLGAEWLDNNIAAAKVDYAKSQGGVIGTVEPMVLTGCNLGCLLIVISLISLVAMMLGVVSNPLKALSAVLGYLWNYFKFW